MDLDALKECKSKAELEQLLMEDVMSGFTDKICYPNYQQVAVVDHLGSYGLNQVVAFFDAVYRDLRVPFRVGDATSLNLNGRIFHRYFLYSDEEPDTCMRFPDGIYRRQDPEIVRLDGISIDLAELTITFKEDRVVLSYDSEAHLQNGLSEILAGYWPDESHPDVKINDSISEFPKIKWLVESLSDFLMSLESREERISLARKVQEFIPALDFEFNSEVYIPFAVAYQFATHMKSMEPSVQRQVLSSLTLVFGLFDDYLSDLDE